MGAGELELEFDTPPGYRLSREGRGVVLIPVSAERPTPCTYGITPPRAARGSLDADAEAALLEVYPGWQRMDGQRRAMRGVSAAGWPYFWNKADLWQVRIQPAWERDDDGPSRRARARAGGVGPRDTSVHPERRILREAVPLAAAARLGVRRRTSAGSGPGGCMALDRRHPSAATCCSSTRSRRAGVSFRMPDPPCGPGCRREPRPAAGGGAYTLRGSELVLTPDGGEPRAHRVRIYEELHAGGWRRVLSL